MAMKSTPQDPSSALSSASRTYQWTTITDGQPFSISSDKTLLSHDAIQSFYGSRQMYWASPMPSDCLTLMISNSLMLGLYTNALTHQSMTQDVGEIKSSDTVSSSQDRGPKKQIGMARMITDHCTIAYLTDVYVLPEYQGKGLGRWLVECCNEIVTGFPWLKAVMMVSDDDERKTRFYEKVLGVTTYQQGVNGLVFMRRGAVQREIE